MHPCELENSALASLTERLADTETRVEKTETHLETTGKETSREVKRKEDVTTNEKAREEKEEQSSINIFSTIAHT